jgi:glycerophosphoryl diester phosphodiesterase
LDASKSILVTGHRGAAGLAPENTLASIQLALDLGVNRIEIDVQQTADNRIIVIHDATLRRTTNGFGRIRNKTFEEIRSLSAGIKFHRNYIHEKIPTLEEVIRLINGKVELLIEVKYSYLYYPFIEKNIIEIIKTHKAKNWCKIISFNDRVLNMVNQLDDSIKLGKLFVGKSANLPLSFDKSINFKPLSKYRYVDEIIVQYKYAYPKLIEKVHSMDKPISVWTVNDEEKFKKLIDLGIDSIITDYPNKLIHLLKTSQ